MHGCKESDAPEEKCGYECEDSNQEQRREVPKTMVPQPRQPCALAARGPD